MKEALGTIINSLVTDKEAVSITATQNERITVLEVKVAENDMGRVIGRDGKMAKSIRTIMKALASKEGKKVNVEFLD